MNKTKKYFVLLITLSTIILGLSVTAFILLLGEHSLLGSIILIFTIILVFVNIKIKNHFDFLRHSSLIQNLIKNRNQPYKTNNKLSINFLHKRLTDLNFDIFNSKNAFDVYYKVDYDETKRAGNKILYAIIVLKSDISFIDNKLMQAFEDLENSFPNRKVKYNKRLFYVFKRTNGKFTNEEIIDANKVFFLSLRRVNIVILNILYNDLKDLYYLNAPNIKTPHIFSLAYKSIKDIINNWF